MDKITTKSIRNVCLMGHGATGKTSLCEAMLYLAKASDRLGRTPEGNTVSDFDSEEIRRGFSLSTTVEPFMWKDSKINIIDTPGYLDFRGEVLEGIRVADSALIVVDGRNGIEVGTELAWDCAVEEGIPRAFFINRFDDGEARFKRVFDSLRERFGVAVCPILIPMIEGDKVIGFLNLIDMKSEVYDKNGANMESEIPEEFKAIAEEYRNMLYESIAETSEELMEKFFAGEIITYNEAINAVHDGIISGAIVPVFCGSATRLWGVTEVMDTIANSFPRPTARKVEKIVTPDGDGTTPIEPDGETSIFIFKTVADPFVGKMSYFKVMNGSLKRDMTLRNTRTGGTEKMSHIYTVCGKKQTEVDSLCCGDIGMTAKLANVNTNDTLTVSAKDIVYKGIEFPEPFLTQAIRPLAKGDEDKISSGIAKLLEEDLTTRYENDSETKQLLISGIGDIHLDVLIAKLKNRFGTSVVLEKPKIAYRETIKKTVEAEGKHKKQSGGHGQYGHVRIRFSPSENEGLTFTESVVGGAVPKSFFPAVEKGLQEAMLKGVLAGYPVVNLAADLYDGSYHDVDSSEMSFKMAASLAYKDGLPRANPVLLEPVGSLLCTVPDDYVGDVLSDINKRRGRVLGMEAVHGRKGYTCVQAEAPKAEMADYPIALRAMTQGRGVFTFRFERYEEVPANVAQKIIDEAKKEQG